MKNCAQPTLSAACLIMTVIYDDTVSWDAHHIPLCDSLPVNCAFEMSVTTLATITYDSPHVTDQFLNHHLQSL